MMTCKTFVVMLYSGWDNSLFTTRPYFYCEKIIDFIREVFTQCRAQHYLYLTTAVSLGFSLLSVMFMNTKLIAAITGCSLSKVKKCVDEKDCLGPLAYKLLSDRFGKSTEYWESLDAIVRSQR